MTTELERLRTDFSEKMILLDNASMQLKKEFFGIDSIIDELIDNIRPWFTLSSIQEKPAIINLWGLTGVGKTSLINRLTQLLNVNEHTHRFDMGEKDGLYSFNSIVRDMITIKDETPMVIILDEFQHARTIISEGIRKEIVTDKNRFVWDLLDSGSLSFHNWYRGLWCFNELKDKLTNLVHRGIKVKNGMIVTGWQKYNEVMKPEIDEEKRFYPSAHYNDILELVGEALNLTFNKDVEELLTKMNEVETLEFLNKVDRLARRPREKSFSSSLIFILGNLDEAYAMASNFNADINPDEFHEASLKITLPNIKQSLQQRFRDEQIARLGNVHLIYPALNSAAYNQIIKSELEKFSEKIHSKYAVQLVFDNTVVERVFKEGVIPTQGTRPLFTTIQQQVKSSVSKFVYEIVKQQLTVQKIQVSVANNQITASFYQNENCVHTSSCKLPSKMEVLRESKQDEKQAIIAVHESGHAVLNAVLLKRIPEVVVSATTSPSSDGFMYSRHSKNYMPRNEIIASAAVALGGILAEELIFGKEYVTRGSDGDLATATRIITQMVKEDGLGNHKIKIAQHSNDDEHVIHSIEEAEKEISQLMQEAYTLAEKTLLLEKKVLLVMANELATKNKLEKNELEVIIRKHAVSSSVSNISDNFYRQKLTAQLSTFTILEEVIEKNPIVVNKNAI